MRTLFRRFVAEKLKRLAQDYLRRNNVQVVFVMGDKYKTHIKENIILTLQNANIPTRGNFKGYNFDIGIPLSILNQQAGFASPLKWLSLLKEVKRFSKSEDGTKVLVMDIELSRVGDSVVILDILTPTVTIVDSLSATSPVVEEFQAIVAATTEKVLVNTDQVPADIFTHDERFRTYGTDASATISAQNIQEHENDQTFTLHKGDFSQDMRMNIFSVHPIYAFLVTNLVLDHAYN